MRKILSLLAAGVVGWWCGGCGGESSRDIPAVNGVDLERYSGVWYEVARLPNRFEEGMTEVSTKYTVLPNGKIGVVNRGMKDGAPKEINGIAKLDGPPGSGELAVSFFWPFYGAYRIIMLDREYRYSVVVGSERDYLWVLARDRKLPPETWRVIMEFLRNHRFPAEKLLYSWGRPAANVLL